MTLITNTATAHFSGHRCRSSIAQFARPANTTAYALKDAISDSTSTAKALEFPSCGQSGKILGATLTCNQDPASTSYRLFVFDSEPTNLVDGGEVLLLAADYPKIVGVFDFIQEDKVDSGAATATFRSSLGDDDRAAPSSLCAYSSISSSLYGLLQVSLGTPTPVSAAVFCLRLNLEVDDRLSSAGE